MATEVAHVVIWPDVFERHRGIVLKASLLLAAGRLQREGRVIHVVAARLVDLTARLATLAAPPFEAALARADEVKRPVSEARQALLSGPSQLQRHPRNVNPMPRSRDFH